MPHSTAKAPRQKPSKPDAEYPLFAHNNGLWAKKIKGKLHYFGKWDDPDAALNRYRDFLAGKSKGGTTVKDLVNAFLRSKEAAMLNDELSPRSFRDYHRTCAVLVEHFGRPRLVEELRPEDFGGYRRHLADTRGAVSLGNEINRVRIVFRYAIDNDLIGKPVKFGQEFERPSRKTLRKVKAEKGRPTFEAAELRKILDKADPTMKAMILLGVNGGLGQSDIAALPLAAIDLKTGWLDFPRPKTAIPRRIPLWPETVAALKAAIAIRPEPADADDAGLVFITHHGRPWVRTKLNAKEEIIGIDAVLPAFQKILDELPKIPRLGFYALRHTHRTVSDGAKDQPASNALMGHAPGGNDMSAVYRHEIADERLKAVTDHVRNWLSGGKRKAK